MKHEFFEPSWRTSSTLWKWRDDLTVRSWDFCTLKGMSKCLSLLSIVYTLHVFLFIVSAVCLSSPNWCRLPLCFMSRECWGDVIIRQGTTLSGEDRKKITSEKMQRQLSAPGSSNQSQYADSLRRGGWRAFLHCVWGSGRDSRTETAANFCESL